jgi:hypothetical protein
VVLPVARVPLSTVKAMRSLLLLPSPTCWTMALGSPLISPRRVSATLRSALTLVIRLPMWSPARWSSKVLGVSIGLFGVGDARDQDEAAEQSEDGLVDAGKASQGCGCRDGLAVLRVLPADALSFPTIGHPPVDPGRSWSRGAARSAHLPQNNRPNGGNARWRQSQADSSEVTLGKALLVAWSAADRSG